ncbi:MAG: protease inhibitor I42 family protein [Nitrospirae bacterium]|nr:protease inhibitor I42 family protein [Nitrospirota bacterium]MBI3352073.1 protease inhibitor I42 family protein [Nitrospirota bacterium]
MILTDQKTRIIHTKVNHPFTIKLWEDRTTAHRWHVEFDPLSLSLMDDDFQRTTIASTVDAGNRVFEFRALKTGLHHLIFAKRMGVVVTEEHRVYQIIAE